MYSHGRIARSRLAFYCAVCFGTLMVPAATRAQQSPVPETTTPSTTPAPDVPNESPPLQSLIPTLPDYSGDWKTRQFLTGDWGGARTNLAEQGILLDLSLTQVFQGNVHGGADTNNASRYSGSWDLRLKFDTARMGLWPAGLLELHAESFFGDSVNDEASSASNNDALFPLPGNRDVMLTQFSYTQALSEHFGFVVGKLDITGGDKNEFAWMNGRNFLHSSFCWNPITARTIPYAPLGAGIFVIGDWGLWTLSVLDTEGTPNESGFDTVFHGGTSVATEVRFNVKPFGLPGHQLAGATWSDKNFIALEQDPRVGITLPRHPLLRLALIDLSLERESSSWSFYYNFDQYLYVEPQDETQGVGLFGRFGISDGQANPIETFYSFGIGGKGIIPERDNDKFGIGYYYIGYAGALPERLGISSAQGIEMFYSIEVTPWFHVTPDLQVIINPGGSDDRDVAIVYGLRAEMSF